ncbi:MAG: membrane protein insertion efficiency factor YidD [Burkholderiales bacterium]
MTGILIKLIRVYQFLLSPWVGNHCRFFPTCSSYAQQAIEQYGPVKGAWLTTRRIARCHPWHSGGADPLP